MQTMRRWAKLLVWLGMAGCGSIDGAARTVGGTVSGLNGSVVLGLRSGQTLPVTANGPFTFPEALPAGQNYDVYVALSPAGQRCVVAHGSGLVGNADVTDVNVTCEIAFGYYPVGGTATGLSGNAAAGLILAEGETRLQLDADGDFVLPGPRYDGTPYAVSIAKLPRGVDCTITAASGYVSGTEVGDITVACVPSRALRLTVVVTGTRAGGEVSVHDAAPQAQSAPLVYAAETPQGQTLARTYDEGEPYSLTMQAVGNLTCTWAGGAPGASAIAGHMRGNTTVVLSCLPTAAYTLAVVATGVTEGVLWVDDQYPLDAHKPLTFDPTQTTPQRFAHGFAPQEAYSVRVVPPPGLTCGASSGSPPLEGQMTADLTLTLACTPAKGGIIVGVNGLTTGQVRVDNGRSDDASTPLLFVAGGTAQAQAFSHIYTWGESAALSLTADTMACFFVENANTQLTRRVNGDRFVAVQCTPLSP